LVDVADSLVAPDTAYRRGVDAIDEVFDWYAIAYPRVRLLRYCGVEAVGWHVDSSSELVAFAGDDASNPFAALYDEILFQRCSIQAYNAVGVTLVCRDQLAAAATLATRLRSCVPRPRLVLGGPLASMLAVQCRDAPFLQLFDEIHVGTGGDDLPRAFGVHSLSVGTPHSSWRRPDWSDVNWSAYIAPAPVVPVLASTGCPYSCEFCSSPTVAQAVDGTRFQARPADDIVSELRGHVEAGRRYFLLVGELLTWTHVYAIAKAIEASGLSSDVAWFFWTRLAPPPPEGLPEYLRAQGCLRICFGLEVMDSAVLATATKGVSEHDATVALSRTVQADIQPHLFLMTGLPGQDREVTDARLLQLLEHLTGRGAHAITATVSPLEVERWSGWRGLAGETENSRDLLTAVEPTPDAEGHAEALRAKLEQQLSHQSYVGAFGNVHHLVFLDRHNANATEREHTFSRP